MGAVWLVTLLGGIQVTFDLMAGLALMGLAVIFVVRIYWRSAKRPRAYLWQLRQLQQRELTL